PSFRNAQKQRITNYFGQTFISHTGERKQTASFPPPGRPDTHGSKPSRRTAKKKPTTEVAGLNPIL
ncbi:hypothetical protein, partial [Salmonella enterica]|uniref:hypothetical protein n=1 Tax=Salmonella enterica TaxID=28901 RepID=UPI003CF75108